MWPYPSWCVSYLMNGQASPPTSSVEPLPEISFGVEGSMNLHNGFKLLINTLVPIRIIQALSRSEIWCRLAHSPSMLADHDDLPHHKNVNHLCKWITTFFLVSSAHEKNETTQILCFQPNNAPLASFHRPYWWKIWTPCSYCLIIAFFQNQLPPLSLYFSSFSEAEIFNQLQLNFLGVQYAQSGVLRLFLPCGGPQPAFLPFLFVYKCVPQVKEDSLEAWKAQISHIVSDTGESTCHPKWKKRAVRFTAVNHTIAQIENGRYLWNGNMQFWAGFVAYSIALLHNRIQTI